MPVTTIEVRRRYSPEQEVAIIEAVHAALVEGLQIPLWDKIIRFVAHEPHRFTSDPGKGESFTLVSIDLFAGRSLKAKRALYAAMAERLAPLGIARDHLKVLLREIPREDWGIRGVPASEIELGYQIEV
jgi:phenylpyruvate tautomerase PptA (4-oxalocrotonate tautomerase family)